MGKVMVTKEMALRMLANNFESFKNWSLIKKYPGREIPLENGEKMIIGSKNQYCSDEEAYFTGAIITIVCVWGDEEHLEFTFTEEALHAIYDYTNYYSLMKGMIDKDIGIILSEEKDEYGLPQFAYNPSKVMETAHIMDMIYGKSWRDRSED